LRRATSVCSLPYSLKTPSPTLGRDDGEDDRAVQALADGGRHRGGRDEEADERAPKLGEHERVQRPTCRVELVGAQSE